MRNNIAQSNDAPPWSTGIQVATKISILSGEAKKSFTEMTLPHLSIVVLIRSPTKKSISNMSALDIDYIFLYMIAK